MCFKLFLGNAERFINLKKPKLWASISLIALKDVLDQMIVLCEDMVT